MLKGNENIDKAAKYLTTWGCLKKTITFFTKNENLTTFGHNLGHCTGRIVFFTGGQAVKPADEIIIRFGHGL